MNGESVLLPGSAGDRRRRAYRARPNATISPGHLRWWGPTGRGIRDRAAAPASPGREVGRGFPKGRSTRTTQDLDTRKLYISNIVLEISNTM